MQPQYDYEPPLDNLALPREHTLTIGARELLVGDVVIAKHCISFTVTDVREVGGFVVATYAFLDMGGTRLFADTQTVTVRRMPVEAAH